MPGSRGRKNHLPRDNLKRASRRKRSFSSLGRLPVGLTFWERQLLSWYIFKKVSRTDHRGRGGHKGERFLRESTSGYCFLCVLSVYSVYSARTLFWFWKDIKRIARLRGFPKPARWLPRDEPRIAPPPPQCVPLFFSRSWYNRIRCYEIRIYFAMQAIFVRAR